MMSYLYPLLMASSEKLRSLISDGAAAWLCMSMMLPAPFLSLHAEDPCDKTTSACIHGVVPRMCIDCLQGNAGWGQSPYETGLHGLPTSLPLSGSFGNALMRSAIGSVLVVGFLGILQLLLMLAARTKFIIPSLPADAN